MAIAMTTTAETRAAMCPEAVGATMKIHMLATVVTMVTVTEVLMTAIPTMTADRETSMMITTQVMVEMSRSRTKTMMMMITSAVFKNTAIMRTPLFPLSALNPTLQLKRLAIPVVDMVEATKIHRVAIHPPLQRAAAQKTGTEKAAARRVAVATAHRGRVMKTRGTAGAETQEVGHHLDMAEEEVLAMEDDVEADTVGASAAGASENLEASEEDLEALVEAMVEEEVVAGEN